MKFALLIFMMFYTLEGCSLLLNYIYMQYERELEAGRRQLLKRKRFKKMRRLIMFCCTKTNG